LEEVMAKRAKSQLSGLAVFSRNHRAHLEDAVAAAAEDPLRLVALRSRKGWVSAERALRAHGPTVIYFAAVDGGPVVEYEAELVEIQLNPSLSDPTTQRLLSHAGSTTKSEELWNNQVDTLYTIRGCRRLKQPFPLSSLAKYEDGTPLSNDYGRTYARVLKRVAV
jgi:hypothetical protein